jgi:hypothetical protein
LSGSDEIFEVSWQALPGKSEAGTFYQVAVSDAAGHIVWRSPETRDVLHPLAFGSWDIGESFPTALADVDGDGALELIAPAARSDVSPVRSRPQPLPRKTAPVGHEWDTAHV